MPLLRRKLRRGWGLRDITNGTMSDTCKNVKHVVCTSSCALCRTRGANQLLMLQAISVTLKNKYLQTAAVCCRNMWMHVMVHYLMSCVVLGVHG